jgi:hypothetical protein
MGAVLLRKLHCGDAKIGFWADVGNSEVICPGSGLITGSPRVVVRKSSTDEMGVSQ